MENKTAMFIKAKLKSDTGGTSRHRILNGFPKVDGMIAVYMPYGPQGKGYYYVKVELCESH